MAKNQPSWHHILAKLYQRGFADARDQAGVLVRSTGEWDAPRNITSIFRERNFNGFRDESGTWHQDFEELLSTHVDSPAGEGFKALRDGDFPLAPDRRDGVARFIAAQLTRGRQFRAQTDQFMRRLTTHINRLKAQNYTEAHWQASIGRVPSPEELQALDTEASTDRRELLQAMTGPIDEITPLVAARTWTLVTFDQPCLFTSEAPVTLWNADGWAALGTADDIALPVSTTKALVLSWPESGLAEGLLPASEEFAARLNQRTLYWPLSEHLLLSLDVEAHPLPTDIDPSRCAAATLARLRGEGE